MAGALSIAAIQMGQFAQDIHAQYSEPVPWFMLETGELTGVSSIMPQKRNPAALEQLRAQASIMVGDMQTVSLLAHNTRIGMFDYRMYDPVPSARPLQVFKLFGQIVDGIVVNKERALAEVRADYSTTTEIADALLQRANVPFRVGHHFASQLTDYGRAQGLEAARNLLCKSRAHLRVRHRARVSTDRRRFQGSHQRRIHGVRSQRTRRAAVGRGEPHVVGRTGRHIGGPRTYQDRQRASGARAGRPRSSVRRTGAIIARLAPCGNHTMRIPVSILALLALSAAAFAGSYPEKPVRLVLPYGPGGGSDVVARPLAHYMSARTGVQFIADNRGGANGNIAMEIVARAPADGYTLALALTGQLAINQSLYRSIPYDPVKDFAPITLLGSAPYFLALNRTVPATTLEEFIKLAREKPGALSYSSTGNGSGLHLSMELLKTMAKIDLVHVPYKSAGAAITDLLAGQVQAQFISYGTGVAHFRAGRVRVLAATTAQRSRALPEIPTIAEAGIPGYDSGVWYALLAPRGTPAAVVKYLHAACVELMKGELGTQMVNDGITPIGSTPEVLAAYIKSESVKWAAVVKRSGATVD